ncbi:MAG: cystathionine beta-synthase, partial [Bacteroidia bacterium]
MHIFAHSKMNSMGATNKLNYVKNILDNMPNDWLKLTTHRLDIYDESRAKVQFTEQLEVLFAAADARMPSLAALPTAYDYIRLGHPLSCLLEWAMADRYQLPHGQVISFSSQTMPILAVLRANLLQRKKTRVVVQG